MAFFGFRNTDTKKDTGNPDKDQESVSSRILSVEEQQEIAKKFSESQELCIEIETAIEAFKILTFVPGQKDKMTEMLRHQGDFEKYINYSQTDEEIHAVMLSERPKGRKLWDNIKNVDFKKEILNLRTAAQALDFVGKKLKSVGLSLEILDFKKHAPKYKTQPLRMDFNGCINEPDVDNLSTTYYNFKFSEQKNLPPEGKVIYDMSNNLAWNEMMKFSSLDMLKWEFYRAMRSLNIPPKKEREEGSLIDKLHIADLQDILITYLRQRKIDSVNIARKKKNKPLLTEEEKKSIYERTSFSFIDIEKIEKINLPDSAKARAVKIHATNHEAELRKNFEQLGAEKNDIDTYIEKMKKEGTLGFLSLPNGEYLSANVHHNIDVKDACLVEDDNYTMLNNPDNLCIIFKKNGNEENRNKQDKKEKKEETIEVNKDRFVKCVKNFVISISEDNVLNNKNLNHVAISDDAKKDCIKELVSDENAKQSFKQAFEDFGLSEDKVAECLEIMSKNGVLPTIKVENEYKQLALFMKQTKRRGRIAYLGTVETSDLYEDVHNRILHNLQTQPTSMEIDTEGNPGDTVVVTEIEKGAGITDRFGRTSLANQRRKRSKNSETNGEENDTKRRSVMLRILIETKKNLQKLHMWHENKQEEHYPVFILGGLGENMMIYSNEDDERAVYKLMEEQRIFRERKKDNPVMATIKEAFSQITGFNNDK